MKYIIHERCRRNIVDFYRHVAQKYCHTYSEYLMLKNIDEAVDNMFLIERDLPRRKPTLTRWKQQGWQMAHAGRWYYAYSITNDTIIVEDACHEQNMNE